MHFAQCRVLRCWASAFFYLFFHPGNSSPPQPHGGCQCCLLAVEMRIWFSWHSWVSKTCMELGPCCSQALLVHSNGAFPSPLCLALKLMVLHSNVDFDTLCFCWSLEKLQRCQLLNSEATANTLKGIFCWYRHWEVILSACLYLLSHMQGDSTAVLHYIASNTNVCRKPLNFAINYHSHVFLLVSFFKGIVKFPSDRLSWCCRLGAFCIIPLLHNVWEEILLTKQEVRWSGGSAIPSYVVEPTEHPLALF